MKYLLFAILLITGITSAQSDKKSEEILEKMSSEIKQMESFYMEFTMQIKNDATGENSKQKGFGYVKGEKYYASLGKNVLISNNVKNWTVVKEEKVTYQSAVNYDDDESMNPKKLMTIWEEGFKSKYVQSTTYKGAPVHEIKLFPVNPSEVNYHTIQLYIGKNNNDLKGVIAKTKDGTKQTYIIESFEENKSVSDAKFVYNPQKFPGYQLIRD